MEICSLDAAVSNTAALEYSKKKEYEKAEVLYVRAIKFDPKCAPAYNNLGADYCEQKKYLEAIKVYQQAFRLDSKWAWIYALNMGRAYAALNLFDDAIKAYSEVIRLKPKEASVYRSRANLYLRLAQGTEAALDAQTYLKLKGWHEESSPYVTLIAYFGYRQANQNEDAIKILADAKKLKTSEWAYQIIRYLRQEISEQQLLTLATDKDKMTEAQTYIGLNLSLFNKQNDAIAHFQWVKENGNQDFTEYELALAELERIIKNAQPKTTTK